MDGDGDDELKLKCKADSFSFGIQKLFSFQLLYLILFQRLAVDSTWQ